MKKSNKHILVILRSYTKLQQKSRDYLLLQILEVVLSVRPVEITVITSSHTYSSRPVETPNLRLVIQVMKRMQVKVQYSFRTRRLQKWPR